MPAHAEGDAPRPPVSALPSPGARLLAFTSILVGGACGGLIGWAVTDLQCTGDCTVATGLGGVLGAVAAAAGVAVVAALVLRAMGEWRTIQHRDELSGPPDAGHANGDRGRPFRRQ